MEGKGKKEEGPHNFTPPPMEGEQKQQLPMASAQLTPTCIMGPASHSDGGFHPLDTGLFWGSGWPHWGAFPLNTMAIYLQLEQSSLGLGRAAGGGGR